MTKKTFETVLEWKSGGTFKAKVEVGADGGSLNPIRTRHLMQEAAYGK